MYLDMALEEAKTQLSSAQKRVKELEALLSAGIVIYWIKLMKIKLITS